MPNPIGPPPTVLPTVAPPGPAPADTPAVPGTAAVTTSGTSPIDGMAPRVADGGAAAGGIVSKARTKLVERTWQEITASRTVGVASLGFFDHGNLAVRLKEKVYRASDAKIAGDANKASTSAALQAATGKTVLWAETGGVVESSAALSTSLPVSGVLNVSVGFSASGLLEYRAMHPFTADVQGARDIVKDHTIELPVDATKARALEPGVEVDLLGRGHAALSSGVSAGVSQGVGPVTANASAGVSASMTRAGTWSLKLLRLDGDKVRVQLAEVKERTRGVTASVNAGLSLDGAQLIDDTLGGSIDAATAAVDLESVTGGRLGLTNERVASRVAREGAKVLEDAVRSYTAFHASVGISASERRTDVASYVLDLATPDGQRAYERLVRLDEQSAAALASRPGVSRRTLNETASVNATSGGITFAGTKLLLVNALRRESEGTLGTQSGTTLVRTAATERSYSGIVTGEKNIKWEGVAVTEAGQAPQHFFHLKFANKDKVTTDQELKTFVRFADALGAKDADPRSVALPSSWLIGRVFSSQDNTRVSTDVYFSDAGVRKIASASSIQLRDAVGRAHADLFPDRQGAPVQDVAAQKLAAEYDRLGREIEKEFDTDARQRLETSKQWQAVDYRRLTGRKLEQDAPVFADAALLVDNAAKTGASGNERGWSALFADIGARKGFDYMPVLAALATVAGSDDTLLHEVSIEGQGIHLRSVDEGSLRDPAAALHNTIAGHGT